MTPLAILAAAWLAIWLGVAWLSRKSDRHMPWLSDLPPDPDPPTLSVIVPCRDEATGVEAAIRSLLAQDLPGLEVVAVDDRSADGTGEILDRLAAADSRLTVAHVAVLPDGWLGKSHAMQAGGQRARGEWLLFTDGDVLFAPMALRRAVGFARRHGLGHLTAAPRFLAPDFLERSFVSGFGLVGSLLFQVWALHRPGTRAFVGIGAFNLVRRDAWERIEGHTRLRLEVVDDVKLGLLLRRSGVPQGAVSGGDEVSVRWQNGFVATMRGLVKNAFAAAEYQTRDTVVAAAVMALAGAGAPLLAALAWGAGQPLALVLALAATGVSMACHAGVARRLAGGSGVEGLFLPVALVLLGGVLAASAVTTLRQGGVRWRGTLYPLAALRQGCVRQDDWPQAQAVGWPVPPDV